TPPSVVPAIDPAAVQATMVSKFEHPVVHALDPDVDQTLPLIGYDEFGLPVWDQRVVQNLKQITRLERAIASLRIAGLEWAGEFPASKKASIDEAIRNLRLEPDAAERARLRIRKAFEQLGALDPKNTLKHFDLSAEQLNEEWAFIVIRRSSE